MKKRKKSPKKYKNEFCLRLRVIRESCGYTQEEFAKLLGISRDTYSKYEYRSLLPHHLIPVVCELSGHDPWFLLTGKSATLTAPEKTALKTGTGKAT